MNINREQMIERCNSFTNDTKKIVYDNKALAINYNALKYIKKLQEHNIIFDAIITDPPYNISKDNNFNTLNRQGIDFGEWDKNFDICEWINLINPIIKKGGSVIIFSAWREMGNIATTLEENGFVVKTLIKWEKKNPMPRNSTRLYMSDTEYAIWAVKKGAKWTFNKPNNVPYLRPLYTSGVVCGKERVGHPTQKSLKIMREIIETHTNPGDLILDPFSGSFTTMIAALQTNRLFVGTELDVKLMDVAKKRLDVLEK